MSNARSKVLLTILSETRPYIAFEANMDTATSRGFRISVKMDETLPFDGFSIVEGAVKDAMRSVKGAVRSVK